MIARQSVVVVTAGVASGTLATFWLSRYVESRLYGVSRLDPASFTAAIVVVVVVVAAASLPACRRAARVNPARMLKEQ
jgi:ABC-type lipoprotein release transport system permease subunit